MRSLLLLALFATLTACSRSPLSEAADNLSANTLTHKRGTHTTPAVRNEAPALALQTAADAASQQGPNQSSPRLAQNNGPLCCCRQFAQGWQHSWRGQTACEAAGGQCVAPDNCRQ
jgi:hypothetical protein